MSATHHGGGGLARFSHQGSETSLSSFSSHGNANDEQDADRGVKSPLRSIEQTVE